MSGFYDGYNYGGVAVGLATFLIIGIFHPLVIKGEYYFGVKIKWAFLVAGIFFLGLTLLLESMIWSSLAGVTAFSCFWSIKEVNEQVKRVEKGWFPSNPKRRNRTGKND